MNKRTLFLQIAVLAVCSLLMTACVVNKETGIPDFKKIVKGEPDAKTYFRQGSKALDAGKYEKAIAEYSKAIRLDATYAEAYYYRGFTYNKMGQYDQVPIADYTKAIELIPNYGDAYKKRAVNFYGIKRCTQAWADVRMARDLDTQIHPGFLDALGKKCPIQKPKSAGKLTKKQAKQRLKSYWNSEPTQEHFGMSVVQGQKEAVELFLAAGLPVDSKHLGDPVLCHAVTSFQYDIAQMLIDKKADVNAGDGRGNPPLVLAVAQCGIPQLPHGATKEDLHQLVHALVDAGADVNAKFRGGHTVYQMAGITKCFEIQKSLKNAGAK